MTQPYSCKSCGTVTKRPGGYCENCEFMTPAEVRVRLRVSMSTYFRLVSDGKLRRVKLGPRKFLISRAEIDNLLTAPKKGKP